MLLLQHSNEIKNSYCMDNKKNIGIVTYWNTEENYGQVLQLFALQWQLRKMHFCPFLLRILPGKLPESVNEKYSTNKITFQRLVDAIKKKLRKNQSPAIVERNFQLFKNHYLSVSEREYTPKDLYHNVSEADIYICGSDQIWNYPNPIYFLDWCSKSQKRISYAASFGKSRIPDYQEEAYSNLLAQFDNISVREKSGIEICEKLVHSKNCMQCLDPTLLLSKEDYCSAINIIETKVSKKYILLYLLGNKSNIDFDKIDNFARDRNCEIIFVPSQGCAESRYKPTYPSIEKWLGLIKNAEYVITNSFHGTVFSIIFQRNFFVLPLVGGDIRMNDRLYSLFDTLDIPYRPLCDNIIRDMPKINYDKVDIKIKLLASKSIAFLEDSLHSCSVSKHIDL